VRRRPGGDRHLDVERSTAEVVALVDARETVCRVVVGGENMLGALTAERFDVVVLAVSSFADPGLSRDAAKAVGVWMPVSVWCRADPASDVRPG
jgi:hypothetical protein